jgi:hypothetical protein
VCRRVRHLIISARILRRASLTSSREACDRFRYAVKAFRRREPRFDVPVRSCQEALVAIHLFPLCMTRVALVFPTSLALPGEWLATHLFKYPLCAGFATCDALRSRRQVLCCFCRQLVVLGFRSSQVVRYTVGGRCLFLQSPISCYQLRCKVRQSSKVHGDQMPRFSVHFIASVNFSCQTFAKCAMLSPLLVASSTSLGIMLCAYFGAAFLPPPPLSAC